MNNSILNKRNQLELSLKWKNKDYLEEYVHIYIRLYSWMPNKIPILAEISIIAYFLFEIFIFNVIIGEEALETQIIIKNSKEIV